MPLDWRVLFNGNLQVHPYIVLSVSAEFDHSSDETGKREKNVKKLKTAQNQTNTKRPIKK